MPVHDSDFAPDPDLDPDHNHDPHTHAGAPAFEPPDSRPLPPPPELGTYDAALTKPRRRRRTAAQIAADAAKLEALTPPLPPGSVPQAGETRFDWRERSLSATPHAPGRHWFPDAWRSRVPPPMTKVSEVQPLWAEIRRYAEQ